MIPLPFPSPLEDFERQAADLLAGGRSADPDATHTVPRDLADAQLALARAYSFRDWPSLTAWVEEVARPNSAVARFESAVEAVITGDMPTLRLLLAADPDLVRARSTIVSDRDPPVHAATLLHYVAANAVEDYRQKTPPNAVEVARCCSRAAPSPMPWQVCTAASAPR